MRVCDWVFLISCHVDSDRVCERMFEVYCAIRLMTAVPRQQIFRATGAQGAQPAPPALAPSPLRRVADRGAGPSLPRLRGARPRARAVPDRPRGAGSRVPAPRDAGRIWGWGGEGTRARTAQRPWCTSTGAGGSTRASHCGWISSGASRRPTTPSAPAARFWRTTRCAREFRARGWRRGCLAQRRAREARCAPCCRMCCRGVVAVPQARHHVHIRGAIPRAAAVLPVRAKAR